MSTGLSAILNYDVICPGEQQPPIDPARAAGGSMIDSPSVARYVAGLLLVISCSSFALFLSFSPPLATESALYTGSLAFPKRLTIAAETCGLSVLLQQDIAHKTEASSLSRAIIHRIATSFLSFIC